MKNQQSFRCDLRKRARHRTNSLRCPQFLNQPLVPISFSRHKFRVPPR